MSRVADRMRTAKRASVAMSAASLLTATIISLTAMRAIWIVGGVVPHVQMVLFAFKLQIVSARSATSAAGSPAVTMEFITVKRVIWTVVVPAAPVWETPLVLEIWTASAVSALRGPVATPPVMMLSSTEKRVTSIAVVTVAPAKLRLAATSLKIALVRSV